MVNFHLSSTYCPKIKKIFQEGTSNFHITEKSTIALLLMGILIAIILQSRVISDFDIFWQIKIGQLMLEQGHLITNEPFSYTHFGEMIPALGWLAQLIFAIAFKLGSWQGVQGFHVMLMTAAYLIVARAAFKERLNIFSVFLAVAIGLLVGLNNSTVRPQSIALFCFALFITTIREDMKISLNLLGLIPIVLLWQNTHPSLAIGFAIISAIAATAWARWSLKLTESKPWGITIAWLIVLATQLATPMGLEIFTISKINMEIALDLQIDEWLHPWDRKVIKAMLFFWLALEITLFLLIKLRAKVTPSEWRIFIVMTGLTLTSARFALFWGVAMIPTWARLINELKLPSLFKRLELDQHSRVPSAFLFCTGIIAILPILLIFGKTTFAQRIPVHGVYYLQRILPEGRIYNCREFGGPLILNGSPNWKINIDGRLYLYPKPDWEEYFNIALGKMPLNFIIQKHHPDAFFLHPIYNRGLIELLRQSSDWQEVYSDTTCITFVKKNTNSHFSK